jgi:DNA-binding CsgD family transcriptional regulator
LRRAGKSYRLIGEWLGVSKSTVENWTKVEDAQGADENEIPRVQNWTTGKVEAADGKSYAASAPSAETLTEREETALRLREEGHTLKEIALAIGVSSPQTASNTLARAESKRVELAEPDEEEGPHTPAKPAIDMRIFELIEYAARTSADLTYFLSRNILRDFPLFPITEFNAEYSS